VQSILNTKQTRT